MPLKSWAFECDGHPVRAEIAWRLTGLSRKRLYIDHKLVRGLRGRFTWPRPMTVKVGPTDEPGPELHVRFRPRRLGLDMNCTATIGNQVLAWDEQQVQIEKQWTFEDEKDRPTRGVAFLVLLPLLLVLAVLYGPLMILGQAVAAVAERRHQSRLRRRSRVLDWAAVEARSRSSPGTLILQTANLAPLRAWWTADDVRSISPLPPPKPLDVMHPGRVDHPFIEWCWSRYLCEETGTGFLTELPKHLLRHLDLYSDGEPITKVRAGHGTMSVVLTGYVARKRWQAARRFAGLLGDTLVDSLAALIHSLNDSDPAVRRLCREALQLAGPAAADAVPMLVGQLYLGPQNDRWSVAETLTYLGPDGLAAVKTAEQVGDPQIRWAAKPARHMHERSIAEAQRQASKAADLPPNGKADDAAGHG